MAIIKCPECGHEVSDKAPVCPGCGAEIAGKVTTCPQCGNVYFSEEQTCPACHHVTGTPVQPVQNIQPTVSNTQQPSPSSAPPLTGQQISQERQPKKNNRAVIIAIVVLALVILGGVLYYNTFVKNGSEQDAYEYAMKSSDPNVLQSYLDSFEDAPEAHRDSIEAHLQILKAVDKDWTNAVISNSKSALEEYMAKHPDSPHKEEAEHKIDSIDWASATQLNTVQAIQDYLDEHPNGEHVDDANDGIRSLNANTVQPEEKQMVSSLFKSFFNSISSHDEDAITGTVNSLLTSFLGKPDATRADVITFMHKIYKDDVESMSWRLPGDFTINKKEIGDDKYEYSVTFSAYQQVSHKDASKTKTKYRISGKVNPDGRITEMNMTKIIE